MNFLVLGISDVPNIINSALRAIEMLLCNLIYPLIADMYNVFLNMGKLVYNDQFKDIYSSISLLLGIYMVFRISFWLIEYLVDPDRISSSKDNSMSPNKIVTRTLIVVVLLALTPTIFEYAFKIQTSIIEGHVIEKLVARFNENDSSEFNMGNYLAGNLFDNFYDLKDGGVGLSNDEIDTCAQGEKGGMKSYTETLIVSGKLKLDTKCVNGTTSSGEYILEFKGLYAVIVGGVVVWMLIMYCISIGTRYVQLIFLQVVAPIPIMCYVSPSKDNMFDKWVKQCTTTYLDLFIRVAIISFIMLLCRVLFADDVFDIAIIGGTDSWIIEIFIILGLLTFAKKAPDLIQELLPKSITKASGDFGLSLKKRTDAMLGGKAVYGLTTGAARLATAGVGIGALTAVKGLAGGRGTGRLSGFFGGLGRGLVNGTKKGNAFHNLHNSMQRQGEVNRRKIDLANSGSTWWGRTQQRLSNAFGLPGTAEKYENEISENKRNIAENHAKTSKMDGLITAHSNNEATANDKLDNKADLKDVQAQQVQKRRQNVSSALTALQNGQKDAAVKNIQAEFTRADTNIRDIARKSGLNDDQTNRLSYLLSKRDNSEGGLDASEAQELAGLRQSVRTGFNNQHENGQGYLDILDRESRAKESTRKLEEGISLDEISTSELAEYQRAVRSDTAHDYVTMASNGIIEDKKISSSIAEIQDLREECLEMASSFDLSLPSDELDKDEKFAAIKGLFVKNDEGHYEIAPELKDDYELDSWAKFDKIKGVMTGAKSTLDRSTKRMERANADIESMPEYQNAVADRDAVGGHSGSKR